jgi:hypothetical protein
MNAKTPNNSELGISKKTIGIKIIRKHSKDNTSDKKTKKLAKGNASEKNIGVKSPTNESKNISRNDLENTENIKNELKGYTFIDINDVNTLKIDYFIKYIKIGDSLENSRVINGGRIHELINDLNNKNLIYQIKLKNRLGNIRSLNIIGKDMFIYYKEKTAAEERLDVIKQWKKNLTPYERVKFRTMKKKVEETDSKSIKKKLRKEFQIWYKERHEQNTEIQ